MFHKKELFVVFAVLAIGLMAAVLYYKCPVGNAIAAEAALSNSDCVKCHPQQPATIASKGTKHKTAVGCLDCHTEHPPQGTQAIPKCAMCHAGKPHYELPECASCHADTHAPLDIKMGEKTTPVCLTCHPQQGNEMAASPSKHALLDCSKCHPAHRQYLDCLKCHDPHTKDMTFETCKACHPPHKPLDIRYGMDTPSETCAACHYDAYDNLKANTTKHHDLSCAYCHRDKHKVVPPCEACHGKPHAAGIHAKYTECGKCHGAAHTLMK